MPISKCSTLHLRYDQTATKSFSNFAVVCNESSEGRSRQGTVGVVQGTLFIFTRPRGPGIAESNQSALTRTDIQGQDLGGESVHGNWKPLALMVITTRDLIRESQIRKVRSSGRMFLEAGNCSFRL